MSGFYGKWAFFVNRASFRAKMLPLALVRAGE